MSFSPTLLPGYVSRDGKIIILARAVRGFSQSYVAVLLALYLNLLGFSVDHFAQTLLAQSLVAFYFATQFGI